MLLQANDFRWLCEHHDVELQMGGSDQWGNITAGIDLIRRVLGRTAHGLTWPLLTLPGGAKMGKSAGGAVWLDPDKTTPYRFRQFWVQATDDEVGDFLRRLEPAAPERGRGTGGRARQGPRTAAGPAGAGR